MAPLPRREELWVGAGLGHHISTQRAWGPVPATLAPEARFLLMHTPGSLGRDRYLHPTTPHRKAGRVPGSWLWPGPTLGFGLVDSSRLFVSASQTE